MLPTCARNLEDSFQNGRRHTYTSYSTRSNADWTNIIEHCITRTNPWNNVLEASTSHNRVRFSFSGHNIAYKGISLPNTHVWVMAFHMVDILSWLSRCLRHWSNRKLRTWFRTSHLELMSITTTTNQTLSEWLVVSTWLTYSYYLLEYHVVYSID